MEKDKEKKHSENEELSKEISLKNQELADKLSTFKQLEKTRKRFILKMKN
jgi:hypothetical protein